MATQTATRKQVVATVKSIAEEEKGGKQTYTLQVLRDGMKYPDYITVWPDRDEEVPERPDVRTGRRYLFTVAAKPKGGDKKGEYWDYLSAESAVETPSTPAQPATTPPAASGQDKTTEAPSVPSSPQPIHDVTRRSIERQKALAEGREAAVALVQSFIAYNPPTEVVPWPSFRDTWAPEIENLTTRFAGRFYRSITGVAEPKVQE